MSARAIWKAAIHLDDMRLPVKLYPAVQDRNIRFRLLHRKDGVPLEQRMLNPSNGEVVEYGAARRGLEVERELFVVLGQDELAGLEPEPSREIRITRFVPPSAIPHQWYDRPYYLGPDGQVEAYFAFARALANREREGVARWAMRKKRYVGALRSEGDHLVLLTLRHAGEVISASQLDPPAGRKLEKKEREMARKFVGALEAELDPGAFRDEYRERVRQLIELKRKGGTVETPEYEEKREPEELAELLEASLAEVG